MGSTLPAKLKIPSIQPFAARAAQLERYRPIIAYWCEYYIVNQILSKGLHSADDECKNYTVTLMDKLETAKSGGEDAIVDDVAAKAYVEQFALETFQRADDSIHTNKASRQTIDTFQAASTFLELLSIWAPENTLDAETAAKIKYSKFHALRIVKAIKAGEDPNASNPVDEQPQNPEDDLLSPSAAASYQPPSVESVPDSKDPSRPASFAQASPLAPPPAVQPSVPSAAEQPDVSPIEPVETTNGWNGSVGGGYFPSVPTFTSEPTPPTVPTAAADQPPTGTTPMNIDPPSFAPANQTAAPQDFYTQNVSQPPPPAAASYPSPAAPTMHASVPAAPAPMPATQRDGPYNTDDEAIAQAQKHSKWAMSALNFEDVPTAVKELRIALNALGAL